MFELDLVEDKLIRTVKEKTINTVSLTRELTIVPGTLNGPDAGIVKEKTLKTVSLAREVTIVPRTLNGPDAGMYEQSRKRL